MKSKRELLSALVELARAKQRPWSMHVAEQAWEADFLKRGDFGIPLLRHLGEQPFEFADSKSQIGDLVQQRSNSGPTAGCNRLGARSLTRFGNPEVDADGRRTPNAFDRLLTC